MEISCQFIHFLCFYGRVCYDTNLETFDQLAFCSGLFTVVEYVTVAIFSIVFLSGFVIFRMLRVARIFHLFRLNAKYDSFNVITTVLYEKRNQIISSVFIVMILMFASSLCMYSVDKEIVEIFVDKQSAGKTVAEIEEAQQITVFLILRDDLSVLPQKNTILKLNDIMIIRLEDSEK